MGFQYFAVLAMMIKKNPQCTVVDKK